MTDQTIFLLISGGLLFLILGVCGMAQERHDRKLAEREQWVTDEMIRKMGRK